MLPQIHLTGGCVVDPDLRFTNKGTPMLKFRMIARDRKRDSDGNWTDSEPWFFGVTAFGKVAENAAASLEKGMEVMVVGRMSIDSWTDKESNERKELNLIADEIGVSLRWGVWRRDDSDAPRQAVAGEENQDTGIPF
jgi:single-strand DNA-binding protein